MKWTEFKYAQLTPKHYKVSLGFTIWDSGCGILPDLEDTYGWYKAVGILTHVDYLLEEL